MTAKREIRHDVEKPTKEVKREWRGYPRWIQNTPSWCIPSAFITIGVEWLFRIPGTGKASALLGVGAALMPIFWEKSKKWARAIWMAMLFLLLGVEYRAIAQDRQEFANQFRSLL